MVQRGWALAVMTLVGCSTAAAGSGTEDSLTLSSSTTDPAGTATDVSVGEPTTSGLTSGVSTSPTSVSDGSVSESDTNSSTGNESTTGSPGGCGDGVTPGPTIVLTSSGAVEGEQLAEVVAFKGVRYAEPPVGDLRLRPPVPRSCEPGVTPALMLGARCPQVEKDQQGNVIAMKGEEDCLTLNVWTPAADDQARPVMVFIHGGGNATGGSADELYDGAALAAAQGVVVATLNYRLGMLGYMTHGALAAESPDNVSGNYGILDQVLALEWVKSNVAGFGGDPGRVTVFGESAGAVNTCTLVGSPKAAGLFHGAIVQSGSCAERSLMKYTSDIAGPWMDASSCAIAADAATCLRELPVDEILMQQPDGYPDVAALGQGWGPHIDGVVVPTSTLSAMSDGTHNAVPLIVGANAGETANSVPPLTVMQYEALVQASFGPLAQMVLGQYPAADYGDDGRAAYIALTSDLKFICGARRAARAADAGQSEPVFRYHFAYDAYEALPNSEKAAFHGLELIYIFANWGAVLDGMVEYSPNADDLAISQRLQSAWGRFAATGDPAGMDLEWPAYVSADDNGALLDEPPDLFNGVRTMQCDFWDMLLP